MIWRSQCKIPLMIADPPWHVWSLALYKHLEVNFVQEIITKESILVPHEICYYIHFRNLKMEDDSQKPTKGLKSS